MMIYSFSPFGYEGALVSVEVDLRRGIPAIDIVGLADAYCSLPGDKAYSNAISHIKSIDMIVAGECGAFNPVLIECLRDCETEMARMLPNG